MTAVSVSREVIGTHPSAWVRSLEQWVMVMVEGTKLCSVFNLWSSCYFVRRHEAM